MSVKMQIMVFLAIVILGVGGYFGWNVYSTQYQVKAFSFDLDVIVDNAFYAAYKAYMSWVDRGVKGGDNNRIHKDLVTKLQPFYSNKLTNVRVAYTTRFENLGMTDCERIYFGNSEIVTKIKQGKDLSRSQMWWLAHELGHTEQCEKMGGRKSYALRWFKEVRRTALNAIKNGDFKNIVSDIFNAQKLAKYDNNMAMEESADAKAEMVVKQIVK